MPRANKRVRIERAARALLNVCNHPDANGIELYRDRPRDEWPRTSDGRIAMVTERLNLDGLIAELEG